MEEKQLEKLFIDFLITKKGYPRKSILTQTTLDNYDQNRFSLYEVDLSVIDTESNNFLFFVEFKSRLNAKNNISFIERVKRFLENTGRLDIPFYLVSLEEGSDFDFITYILRNNEFRKIDKEDIPLYETIKSKAELDAKKRIDERFFRKDSELKKKKIIVKNTAISSIISLIIGIVAIIFFYTDIVRLDNSELVRHSFSDSLEIKVKNLERQLSGYVENDSTIKFHLPEDIDGLNKRLSNIEMLMSQNPNSISNIQRINYEIKELNYTILKEKEICNEKLISMEDKLSQISIWVTGLLITIFGSIIGFAFNVFWKS